MSATGLCSWFLSVTFAHGVLQFLEHCAKEIPNHAVLNGSTQYARVGVGRGGLEGVAEHALQGGEQFVALVVCLSEMLYKICSCSSESLPSSSTSARISSSVAISPHHLSNLRKE